MFLDFTESVLKEDSRTKELRACLVIPDKQIICLIIFNGKSDK